MARNIEGRKINREKLNKLKTANEHFDEKYGKEGTNTRIEFEYETVLFSMGEMLKESRLKLDLTQEELAERTGLKRSYISKIEKGETDIRLSNFLKLLLGLELNSFNLDDLKTFIKKKVIAY